MAPFFVRSHVFCNYRLSTTATILTKSSAERNLIRIHLFFISIQLTSPSSFLNDFLFRSRLFVAFSYSFFLFLPFSSMEQRQSVQERTYDKLLRNFYDISLCRQLNLTHFSSVYLHLIG